jgi:putative flippase GtrA
VLRYAGSGSLNTLSGFAVIFLLMWLGVSPWLANVAGYAVGFVLGFMLTKRFVFRSNGHIVTESVRYLIAFAIAFLFNLLMLQLSLNGLGLPAIAAQLVAAASYTLSMYFLSRVYVFGVTGSEMNKQ